MLMSRNVQRGFTLIELLVAMAVGLVVLGGVLSVYLTTIRTSHATLQASRLNQEMAAILNIMANDIRRAGYWGDGNVSTPDANPFSQVDTATAANTTAVRVHYTDDNGANYTDKTEEVIFANRQGSCITYAYDRNGDGDLDDDEKFGFRWDGQSDDGILMRRSAPGGTGGTNICNSNTDIWESLTDTGTIEITGTGLNFSLEDSSCLNTDNAAQPDCYANIPVAGSGDATVESLRLAISLNARLADDPDVKAEMTQTVQVRNLLVRTY